MTIRNEFVNRNFVLAGAAIFTIETPEGKHYTFRVERTEPTDRFPKPAWFVNLLTGPDNESDYTYLGKLDDFSGQVATTAKSKSYDGTYVLRLLNRVLARVWTGDHAAYMEKGFRTHHEGRCGRCGRRLTVPSSINSGIGPECAKQMSGAVKEIEAELRESYSRKAEAARLAYKAEYAAREADQERRAFLSDPDLSTQDRWRQKFVAEKQVQDALAANPTATIEVQGPDGKWIKA